MTQVVIAGVSTRAAAASAAHAGFDVIAIDGYADRDQHPRVTAISLPREGGVAFTAAAAAAAAARVDAAAAVYLSNFENDSDAVARLAVHRELWGNPPDVLRRARDPFLVAGLFRAHGIQTPLLSTGASDAPDANDAQGHTWLLKPFCSGGGHGIRPWRHGQVGRGHYRQQRIDGTPGSIVFVAAAGRAVPLGVSRQLIGDERFGATGYRYCGSILAPTPDSHFARPDALVAAAHDLARIAAAELSLQGVNGIDFVASGGIPSPLEINPRWTASMELVERATGASVFAAHATACTTGRLGSALPAPARAIGKAIVFSRHSTVAGDTDDWLHDPDIADVPHPGDAIAAGSPVCTVFAEAAHAASCEAALVLRAQRIYADLDAWSRVAVPANPEPGIGNHE
jgi:predicted ATP-grasp superfamily ATP-dependent carboligase